MCAADNAPTFFPLICRPPPPTPHHQGVLNYVILRPICTGLAFITDIFDEYGEGQINFRKSYVYLAAVTNFSQVCVWGVGEGGGWGVGGGTGRVSFAMPTKQEGQRPFERSPSRFNACAPPPPPASALTCQPATQPPCLPGAGAYSLTYAY